MAKLNSKAGLSAYCLRQLGSPVINIELDVAQIDDNLNDAVALYLERHFNGVEEVFWKHVVTAADVTKGYITTVPEIVSVLGILSQPLTGSGEILENINFSMQASLNSSLANIMATNVTDIYMAKQHISLIDKMFERDFHVEFNSAVNRLRVTQTLTEGATIILHAYRSLDPDEQDGEVWDDRWLKKYATALLKKQWGSNIRKFKGVQLPNGMTMDGEGIYGEAVEEITKLEEELELRYEEPPEFFIG